MIWIISEYHTVIINYRHLSSLIYTVCLVYINHHLLIKDIFIVVHSLLHSFIPLEVRTGTQGNSDLGEVTFWRCEQGWRLCIS